jgi:hypothetical protein
LKSGKKRRWAVFAEVLTYHHRRRRCGAPPVWGFEIAVFEAFAMEGSVFGVEEPAARDEK